MACNTLDHLATEGHTVGNFFADVTDGGCEQWLADSAADWDVVIFTSFKFEACAGAVGAYPATKFVLIDTCPFPNDLPNLLCVLFSEGEVAYAAGHLAGLVTQSKVVAVAGGYPFPAVQRFLNGFQLGAKSSCPDCTVLGKYMNTFDGQGGVEFANEVVAAGADVVYGCGGFTGTLAILTAAELGAHVIGVDVDEYSTNFGSATAAAKGRVLTSTLKQADRGALLGALVWIEEQELPGDNTLILDYANNGVSLAPCHESCTVGGTYLDTDVAAVEQAMRLRTMTPPLFGWAVSALPGDAGPNQWHPVETFSNEPSPRATFAVTPWGDPFALKRYIVTFGGQSNLGVRNNELWYYDLTSLHWVKSWAAPANAPPPTSDGCAVTIGDNGWGAQVHVFGGMTDAGLTNDMHAWSPTPPFGPTGETWSLVDAGTGPSARSSPACVLLPDAESFAVFGGRLDVSFESDLWVYTRGSGWTEVTGSGPAPRKGSGIAVGTHDGHEVLVVAAGQKSNSAGAVGTNDVWARRLDTMSGSSGWVQLPELPVTLLFTPLVDLDGTVIVWAMEELDSFTSSGRVYPQGHYAFVFDIATQKWSPQPQLGPSRKLAVGVRVPVGFPMFTDLWSLGGQGDDGLRTTVMGATYMLKPICAAGTTFDGQTCASCAAGTYSYEGSEGPCLECMAGQYTDDEGQASCKLCPEGSAQPLTGQATCSQCPAGYSAATSGTADCEPCNPGYIAPDVGTASCQECSAGAIAPNAGSTECELCAPGSANPVPGFTKCEVCPAGYEAVAAGTPSCSRCEIGFYADSPGTPECTVCPDTFTTLALGSASLSACACPEGRFWSVRDDTCKPCPLDAYCPGGLYLPVVRPAKYGLLKGSATAYAAAVEAKHSNTFDKANFQNAISDMIVYNCHSLDLCPSDPAFESEATTPWDFEFYGVDRKIVDGVLLHVRHGSAEGDTGSSCTKGRSGVACGRCEEGSYGRLECTECSGAANGLNAVLLLILPFIMMALYRLTSAKDTRRVQTAFVMVSTFGMGAFVIQTVAVFDSFAVNWPIQLSWVFTLGDIFMFDMGGLSLSCLSGQDFQPKYWLSLMVPVLIVFMTGVGFMLSKVLPVPADWVMQRDQTFNMLGMLLTALYVTLVKIVVAYFECTDNPSQGHETLLRYRDIECASEERMGATVPMVMGLLVYVIGFYVKFLHIAYSAPGEWPKPEFREKWRFMLTRWRPDVWFWGSLVMTRNLLVALAGIVSAEPRVQLIYLVWVVTTVFTLTAVWQPWRIPSLNISDVLSCVILNGIGVFGLVFVSLDDEIDLNTRLGRTEVAEKQKSLQDGLAIILGILFAAFVGTFLAVIGWALILLVPGRAVVAEAEMEKTLKGLYDEAVETINDSTIQQDLERLVYHSTDHDRKGLRSILEKLRTSPEQVTQTGYFGKKTKQPAKKQVVTSTQVSA